MVDINELKEDPYTGPLYEVRLGHYLKTGWQTFLQYPVGFLGFGLVLAIVAVIRMTLPNIVKLATELTLPRIAFFDILLSATVSVLKAGIFIVSAKLLQRRTCRFTDFFAGFHYLRPLIIFCLFYFLIADIPSLCFYLFKTLFPNPSYEIWEKFIYYSHFMFPISNLALLAFELLFLFTPLLIIDRRLGLWEAMDLSRRTVQRRCWLILGFILLVGGGLAIIGVVISWTVTHVFASPSKFQFSGLRVTVPFLSIIITAAYADLFGLQSQEY